MDPKYLNIPNICFSLTDINDKREPEFIKQRLTRGFDDSETWSLRDTISNFILPRLIRFKEIASTHPFDITEQEWLNTLEKMIKSFELISRDNGALILTEEETLIMEEGLDLFRKDFLTLWW